MRKVIWYPKLTDGLGALDVLPDSGLVLRLDQPVELLQAKVTQLHAKITAYPERFRSHVDEARRVVAHQPGFRWAQAPGRFRRARPL